MQWMDGRMAVYRYTETHLNQSIRTTMHLSWTFWVILGHFGTFWVNSEDF